MLAYSFSKERYFRELDVIDQRNPGLAKWAISGVAVIYIQLILGALMRHTGSGLAIPDFPMMAGSYLPAFNDSMLAWVNSWRFDMDLESVSMSQIYFHMIHRIGAVIVFAVLIGLFVKTWLTRKTFRKAKMAWVILAFMLVQISLGIATVLSVKQVSIASLHVVVGAGLLGVSVLFCLRCLPLGKRYS